MTVDMTAVQTISCHASPEGLYVSYQNAEGVELMVSVPHGRQIGTALPHHRDLVIRRFNADGLHTVDPTSELGEIFLQLIDDGTLS